MNKHAISIKWSDEDNGFIATIPGIKALSAFGVKREKALSELKIAAEAYFKALEETGKPSPLPEKIVSYSGQLRLRMPKSLHAALSNGAEDEGISLNTYIVTLLSERHIGKKLLKKIEAIENFLELTNSKRIPDFISNSQPTHKIEENNEKYRNKKIDTKI
jgi:predicted HicB family RNase H-like nuclease